MLLRAGADAGAEAIAVAFYDYLHRTGWSYHAERWFHAASTIKVPVLLGVFAAIDQGLLQPYSRVHVRNRFLSAADNTPYRVDPARDSNSEVHAALAASCATDVVADRIVGKPYLEFQIDRDRIARDTASTSETCRM